MARFNSRRLSRRLSTSLTFLFVFAIFSSFFGEFLIELGKERGWYDSPSDRLAAAMTAFSNFVTHPWFLLWAAFLTGLTVGLWADVLLRRRESTQVKDRPTEAPLQTGDPGSLDYIVEGLQSIKDITSISHNVTRDTVRITRTFTYYQMMFGVIRNFERRRRLATRLAAKLTTFSEKMDSYAPLVADAGRRTYTNCLAVIETTAIFTPEELKQLLAFKLTLEGMAKSTMNTAAAMEQTKNSVTAIMGITRELNGAADLYSATIGRLSIETRGYSDICARLVVAAENRSVAVAKMIADKTAYQPQADVS